MTDDRCFKCRGAGRIDDLFEAFFDFMNGAPDLPCEKCPRCGGSGKEPSPDSYEYQNWH